MIQEQSSFELSYMFCTLFRRRPLLSTTPLKRGCFLHEGLPSVRRMRTSAALECVIQEQVHFELSYVSCTLFKSRPLLPTTPLKSGCFLHEGLPSVRRMRTSAGLECVIQEQSSFRSQLCVLHTFQESTSPLDNTTEKRVFSA